MNLFRLKEIYNILNQLMYTYLVAWMIYSSRIKPVQSYRRFDVFFHCLEPIATTVQ